AGTFGDGKWYKVDLTYDGANLVIYLNGAAQSTASYAGQIKYDTTPLVLGAMSDGSGGYAQFINSASLNEFRVSSVARSADWLATEYNNQRSPSTFYTVGMEQTVTAAVTTPMGNGVALHTNGATPPPLPPAAPPPPPPPPPPLVDPRSAPADFYLAVIAT